MLADRVGAIKNIYCAVCGADVENVNCVNENIIKSNKNNKIFVMLTNATKGDCCKLPVIVSLNIVIISVRYAFLVQR